MWGTKGLPTYGLGALPVVESMSEMKIYRPNPAASLSLVTIPYLETRLCITHVSISSLEKGQDK
jgi:hypothetical protein